MNAINNTRARGSIKALISGNLLELKFEHGKTVRIDASQLTDEIKHEAMMHGLKQKCVDSAAIARDPDTGKSATIETKYQAVKAIADRLLHEKVWNKGREAGTGKGSILLQALYKYYNERKSLDELREFLAKLSNAQKIALENNPKVKVIIDELLAEKVAHIDSDDLLAGLDGDFDEDLGEDEEEVEEEEINV